MRKVNTTLLHQCQKLNNTNPGLLHFIILNGDDPNPEPSPDQMLGTCFVFDVRDNNEVQS